MFSALRLNGLALAGLGFAIAAHGAPEELPESELSRAIAGLDAQLFDVGFNQCRVDVTAPLIAADFEFFHDESGITESREAFLDGMRDGLCKLDYQPIRELLEHRVFELKNNGVRYGAIQTGRHRFLARYPEKEPFETATADFTHVWLLTADGEWKLGRVLSYHHVPSDSD